MVRILLAACLLSASAAAFAQSAEPEQSIVVTGVRLDEGRQRLAACIARKCPPMEDIAATLRYADALFSAGDYRKASSILSRSIGRNGDEARRYPSAVAGLYRALARVSIHQGDGQRYRSSAYGVVRALEAGLPDNDPRIVGGKLEAAEMHASLGEAGAADGLYKSVAAQARRIGRPDLAATAELRGALFDHRRGFPGGRERIAAIARRTDPETRIQQLAARIMLARIDRERGDLESSNRLVEELAGLGLRAPALIYAPPIELARPVNRAASASFGGIGGSSTGAEAVPTRSEAMMEPQEGFDYWADIGFWIEPNGRVAEVELLRSKGPSHWLQPVLGSIAGRIYTPVGADGAPTYRVERFSYTSLTERRTGTRIVGHSSQGRIESIDLTPEEARKPASPR
jgi:hypothetical protein